MIDRHFIESAIQIRRKYLKTSRDLTGYQEEIEKMIKFFKEKCEVLEKIENDEFKNKPKKEEVQRVIGLIMKEITSIELEEKNLTKRVEVLNLDLKKIQQEEEILYNKIKERYPKLSDDEIKEQIQTYLEE